VYLKLLKETAMRRGEAWYLKWVDVDLKNHIVTCNTPEKNSRPRIFKISNELAAMLDRLKRNNEYVFDGHPISAIASTYEKQRLTISRKLGNPRLLEITLHTFRHWRATWLYHETKDILYVMKFLGHKNIKNTLIHIDLEVACCPNSNDNYISRVAKTEQEICSCIESGFEYVCDFQNAKIFRKRK
jgi:integrase